MNIVIVGAGELGQAVAGLLREKHLAPDLWDIDLSRVPTQKPLESTVPAAAYVFFCVPSWVTRAAVTGILPFLGKGTAVVSFAKGIEAASGKTVAELLEELLPSGQPFAVIGGPMIAKEIARRDHAVGIIASRDAKTRNELAEMLSSEDFRTETSPDVLSVSLASVLKNAYALALGVADGLVLSNNEKGWVASRAITEMHSIATTLGADPTVVLGTAGIADFIATGYSPHSRNRTIGHEIATTGICNLLGEGPVALPLLVERLHDHAAAFPLLLLVKNVVVDCSPARPAFEAFFASERMASGQAVISSPPSA